MDQELFPRLWGPGVWGPRLHNQGHAVAPDIECGDARIGESVGTDLTNSAIERRAPFGRIHTGDHVSNNGEDVSNSR